MELYSGGSIDPDTLLGSFCGPENVPGVMDAAGSITFDFQTVTSQPQFEFRVRLVPQEEGAGGTGEEEN